MELVGRSGPPKNKTLAHIVDTPEGVRFECAECSESYDDKEQLEVHLCTHFKEYRFVCGICGTGLKRKEHLDRHVLGHQEVRPHVCPQCGKGFKRKEHLTIHLSIHSGDKNQVCPLCDRSFYRKDHLQKHLQTHNKFIDVKGYSSEFVEVKKELYVEDEQMNPVYIDESEDNIMQMEVTEDYQEEEQVPYIDEDRPFACDLCNKTYKRRDHLKLHRITHMEKNKICPECGKAFHKDQQLLNHMNVHLKKQLRAEEDDDDAPDQQPVRGIPILPLDPACLLTPRPNYKSDRPHECPICHSKFKRKQHLKVHANVHLKIQQPIAPTIWCSLCNEGFHNNAQFEGHQCSQAGEPEDEADETVTHPAAEVKKENFEDPRNFVDETDESIAYLNQPVMSLLEEQNIPTPQRVYVCKFCAKPFKRKDHYKIHLHIHTGIKSFFCPDCGKGFYRKDHLQKHELVHAKSKNPPPKPKKAMPDLFPIGLVPAPTKRTMPRNKNIKPEITITAPSSSKLRVPLKIKVPYQMVVEMDNGEQRAVTIDPHAG